MVPRRIVSFIFPGIVALCALAWSAEVTARCTTTPPPKDAVVLFDGKDTSEWVTLSGDPCPWSIEDGAMVDQETHIMTKREFADHQLHVEFYVPVKTDPNVQGNGNSGVYVHGEYEIQLIDSYGVAPHPGDSCGAIYGQVPPMVNASLPAGEWQSFDILFHAPSVDAEGNVLRKARFSVMHNGIWIHDNVEADITPYGVRRALQNTGPLMLQYHGYPVRFRNIWLRPIPSSEGTQTE
jgi:hypothetical protein